MRKVIFKLDDNGNYLKGFSIEGKSKTSITMDVCYKFINQFNTKCLGSDKNGYIIYEKCR